MEEIIKKETMTSLEIAEVTGKQHQHILRDIDSLLAQGVDASNFGLTSYKDKSNREQRCYQLTKKGCLILASGYDALLREKIINRWEQLETGKTTPYYISINKEDETRARMAWVKGCKELLNLSDASTLALMKKVANPLGLPTPDYVPSKGILKSASELLKSRNTGISAQAFNKLAIKEGFLEEKTRPSSNGKTKTFKAITSRGEYYGENQTSPNNPKETQPLWYEEKFEELLTKLLGE